MILRHRSDVFPLTLLKSKVEKWAAKFIKMNDPVIFTSIKIITRVKLLNDVDLRK